MVNGKLPIYVPSQCSGHSVEYFLRNIDFYDCFLAIIFKLLHWKTLWNDSDSRNAWVGMVSVGLCYNRSTKPSLLLTPWKISSSKLTVWEFSLDPLISYSLCLVSGHISDLALELSFAMADRVLAYF